MEHVKLLPCFPKKCMNNFLDVLSFSSNRSSLWEHVSRSSQNAYYKEITLYNENIECISSFRMRIILLPVATEHEH